MLFGVVRHESPSMPFYYLRGLAIEILGAFLISWLLLFIPPMSYGASVRFVGLIGLTTGMLTRLPDWNWWSFSTTFTLASILDLVIGWLLAGLVIAKVVARR